MSIFIFYNPLFYAPLLSNIRNTPVVAFIQDTQPKEWEKLEEQYGKDAPKRFCYRLAQEIYKRGCLPIFRKGIKNRDADISMAFFKPASSMNPEHADLFNKNRFTVVRQLKYSSKSESSIDMVIFLNGIPIITMELKNSLTGQFVENAKKTV
jgi:type I restriction enzyme R subunit